MATKEPEKKAEAETTRATTTKIAGHEVVELEEFLLNGGVIPQGVDYRPYETPTFAKSSTKKEES